MTAEEAMAQELLRRHRTVNGNLLAESAGIDLSRVITSTGRIRVEKEPSIDMPLSGHPYTFMGVQGVAPAQVLLPAIGASVIVVGFTVPSRSNGTIEFIANQYVGGGWVEGSGGIIWQVLADAVPVQGYDAILGSLGATSNPGSLGRSPIRIFENQLIQLNLKNVSVAAAGQVLLGLFRGHFYSIEQEGQNTWL